MPSKRARKALNRPARQAERPQEAASSAAVRDPRVADLAGWAAIFLAVLIAYAPALHGARLWDDAAHITRPDLQTAHGLWRIWFDLGATQQYYPLLHSAFWIEHRIWGDAVTGYHLVNIVLHALAACLVVAFAFANLLPVDLPLSRLISMIDHPVLLAMQDGVRDHFDLLDARVV